MYRDKKINFFFINSIAITIMDIMIKRNLEKLFILE